MRSLIHFGALFVALAICSGCGPAGIPLPQHDDFDGQSTVEWTVLNADESNVSIDTEEGCLALTPQMGRLYSEYDKSDSGPVKNMHLIALPEVSQDFVVTLRIKRFEPTVGHEKCGIIFYNDADNFINGYVRLTEPGDETLRLSLVSESGGGNGHPGKVDAAIHDFPLMLRLTKQGDKYQFSYSQGGGEVRQVGEEGKWGDGMPKYVGFYASSAHHDAEGLNPVVIESFDIAAF